MLARFGLGRMKRGRSEGVEMGVGGGCSLERVAGVGMTVMVDGFVARTEVMMCGAGSSLCS